VFSAIMTPALSRETNGSRGESPAPHAAHTAPASEIAAQFNENRDATTDQPRERTAIRVVASCLALAHPARQLHTTLCRTALRLYRTSIRRWREQGKTVSKYFPTANHERVTRKRYEGFRLPMNVRELSMYILS